MMNIQLEPIREILRMGGPWIARLRINNKGYNFLVLDQDVVYDESKTKATFVLYVENEKAIFFKLLVFDMLTQEFSVSKKSYEKLYICRFENNEISFVNSFHNQNGSLKYTIPFDEMYFSRCVDAP